MMASTLPWWRIQHEFCRIGQDGFDPIVSPSYSPIVCSMRNLLSTMETRKQYGLEPQFEKTIIYSQHHDAEIPRACPLGTAISQCRHDFHHPQSIADDGFPRGTSYEELTYYNQYVDAGSESDSPFVIDKLTPHEGGILFYYSTELISKENANTFRLTSVTGLFDFFSFYLEDLGHYTDDYTGITRPMMTITSNTGLTRTFSSSVEEYTFEFFGESYTNYSYRFEDSGLQTMNWTDVTWVDFTTQYTKAKTSDFVLKTETSIIPEPSSAMIGALMTLGLATRRRRISPA